MAVYAAGNHDEEAPMSTVEMLNRDELEARKVHLLARAGMAEDELRARGEQYALTEGEAAILDELEDLDFLLASD